MLHSHRRPFPAHIEDVVEWVTSLGLKKVKAKTISSYLVGLRSHHVDLGYAREELETFTYPLLKRIIAGIRRRNGEAGTRERAAITRDVLLNLLAKLNQFNRDEANMHAAFSLAFAGFLRMGEFTYASYSSNDAEEFARWHVTRQSITFRDNYMELHLPASKTDPWRHGVTIPIAATNDAACPMRSMRHLFHTFPSDMKAPLFQFVDRRPFSRHEVIEILRKLLKGAPGHYSGHSFRRGAATWAENHGISHDEIMTLGRWKSSAYRVYIDRDINRVLDYSRRFQTAA